MTEEERLEILNWVCSISLSMRKMEYGKRSSYQLHLDDKTVPIAIWKIKKRILDKEGLHGFRQEPFIQDIVTCIWPGGFIPKHTDPNDPIDSTIHTRFNVFITVPKVNFEAFYAGMLIESKERHYVLCRSGLDLHYSDFIRENLPRIGLSFGFLLPKEKLDTLYHLPSKIKYGRTPNRAFNNYI